MKQVEQIPDKHYVYASLFLLANQVQTLMDKELQPYDMTSRQWFMSVVLETLFDKPPLLKELAEAMATSHQNVRQIAAKLESKGFLRITKDEEDARALRIQLTDKNKAFWEALYEQSEQFMACMFDGIPDEDFAVVRRTMERMNGNLEGMAAAGEQSTSQSKKGK